ncbi:MAG TPA: hypothetical protein VN862_02245 [Candidatus Acidoferrales bacterium]|nr:hypothetical protein [Candidatus Acidoferrales bacterium]
MKRFFLLRLWPVRLIVLSVGSLMAWSGWRNFNDGNLWSSGYNPRTGTVETGPTVMIAVLGGALMLAAILPWPSEPPDTRSNRQKRRDRWRRRR